jgi:segregation and condensation protein B
MDEQELKHILEVLLLSSAEPLSIEKILAVFEIDRVSRAEVKRALQLLEQEYAPRAIELKEIVGGYCIQSKVNYSHWIMNLMPEKPVKYSRALLEVLAIIAYKQPVTRADIEDIRGVTLSTSMLKTLLEREWICLAGYRDVPGKPAVYTTTKAFLNYFNLASLNDLPLLDRA